MNKRIEVISASEGIAGRVSSLDNAPERFRFQLQSGRPVMKTRSSEFHLTGMVFFGVSKV